MINGTQGAVCRLVRQPGVRFSLVRRSGPPAGTLGRKLMHRLSLLVAAAGMALTGMAGSAHADGPSLPANARSTVVTVSPSKVKPGETVRVKVRCMTHVGGK